MPRTTVAGPRRRPAILLATAAASLAVGVAGCGSSDSSSSAQPSPSASASVSASATAGVLGIQDPWVKAADKGMTAAFGTLVNDGDTDVTITAAATDVSPMELHEMTMKDGKMVMQPKQGGIVVKAHSSTVLQPGGEHLMLMDLKQPVKAGDELTFTLTFADGKTQTFTAVAKPFTGAQESYAPDHGQPAA
ncbi:copper chaperone PCu(A)C [Micromonospora sp. NPDC006431]|uniref:copper chaperone PCu(A)C n=1 Tax=Micromonospora sp. NPDC006431 TaxID=3364235 RepID=UPI0036A099B8